MPKRPKKRKQVNVIEYDSDDERKYAGEDVPDPTQDDYFHDAVDQFHAQKDKILFDKGLKNDEEYSSDSDEEVLGLGVGDDDLLSDEEIQNYKKQLRNIKLHKKKDEMGSDIEEDVEKGLPDMKAWGKKRSKYYGADISDDDIDLSGSEEEEGAAVLEEREALNLQKRMAAELDDMDFGLDIFKKKEKVSEEEPSDGKIKKDLSKLSKKEKLQLLKKESPEMLPLIEDFKTVMTEAKDVFVPLLRLVKSGKISGKTADYIQCKLQLSLNYCTNISFYMMLKAKHVPVQNHPVIKRLVQYRNLMKQLEPADAQLQNEIQNIVTKIKNGEEILLEEESKQSSTFIRRKSMKTLRKKVEERKRIGEISSSEDSEEEVPNKRSKQDNHRYETEDEKAALAYYDMMKKGRISEDENEEEDEEDKEENALMEEQEEEDGEGGKRAITYQIEKNKGLTPHKKKELRNPRVKHRMKFRKAKIRRRGQIREVRTEMSRYGGEISGIRSGIKRGIKMKV
ncbi:something about silencing protein 10-like [Ostrea edulis]|uniref:something about silencing protein 10-like n=1 Tax=Ostrea edulis TaxID=37623 RepID=UPI0024AEDC6E|nr:something about silencing protein 10-like [Ostrea edulis]